MAESSPDSAETRLHHSRWHAATDAQKVELAFLYRTGLALQSILGAYVSGPAGTLVDFQSMRSTGVPSHWTAEHITRYGRFMQFLQQMWYLDAAVAELATTLMIDMRPMRMR
jgi:hypothetical protein